MRKICLFIALILCSRSLWPQVEPSGTGGWGTTNDDSLMTLPPQLSGSFYPAQVGDQERENLLSGGILFTSSYDDNVLVGQGIKTVGAESYEIFPSIALTSATSRLRGSLNYSPGFTFYHPTTELNEVTENAVGDFQYRWTPHTTLAVQEVFYQNSTVFSSPYTVSGATISANPDFASSIVIVPYAGQLTDNTEAQIGYQFSRRSMITGSGRFSTFRFSDTAQTAGLFNSNSGGGSGAYSRRLTRSQYLGVSYEYSISKTDTYSVTTKNNTGSVFYSVNMGKAFSFTITGGPEYSTTSVPGSAPIHTWAPSFNGSVGWQRSKSNVALSYGRAITTGFGLLGSFTSDHASLTAEQQFSRRLIGVLNGNYSNTANATPLIFTYTATGHTLFGRASLQYLIGQRFTVVGEYSRLHAVYSQIAAISNDPDADRVAISVNYTFQKPLGR